MARIESDKVEEYEEGGDDCSYDLLMVSIAENSGHTHRIYRPWDAPYEVANSSWVRIRLSTT